MKGALRALRYGASGLQFGHSALQLGFTDSPGGGGEGDVPDIGLAADIEDVDDGFVIGVLIAAKDDGLVRKELGKLAELGDEFLAEMAGD